VTKPLTPAEKEEKAALKAGEKAGKPAAQVMTELREKRVREARQALDADEAAKEPARQQELARQRAEHEADMAARKAKEAELEAKREAQKQAEAEDAESKIAAARKTETAVSTTRERGSAKTRTLGYTRCPGSTLNVEEAGLALVGDKVLRDSDPWNYRGKRVECPECKHKVGVSPFGKRKEAQPTGYRIDTHYRKP
jgi:hypothetical protein